jgi:hypothetical protein
LGASNTQRTNCCVGESLWSSTWNGTFSSSAPLLFHKPLFFFFLFLNLYIFFFFTFFLPFLHHHLLFLLLILLVFPRCVVPFF